MPYPILRTRLFLLFIVPVLAGVIFTLYVQYTANVEARARVRHHLDQQFFSYLQTQLDQKRIFLSAIPPKAAVPVSSVIPDRERELFPHETQFKLAGLYFVADQASRQALIYRGRQEDGLALFQAAAANEGSAELQALRYDPTNGTRSSGSDFALLVCPK